MWTNPQETEGLVTYTEEILNYGKLHFLRNHYFRVRKHNQAILQMSYNYMTGQ